MNTYLYKVFLAVFGFLIIHNGSAIATPINANGGTGIPPPNAKSAYFKQVPTAAAQKAQSGKALGGETLRGMLAGEWDEVTGVISFPWTTPDGQDLYVVALGLPAQRRGQDNYDVAGWNRELFFIDVGDGVPRLLSATLLDADFVPESGDAITQSGQLWSVQYMFYQEAEELNADPDFYANYPNGASLAEVRFITDDSGTVIQLAIDITDQDGNYLYSVEPKVGDRYDLVFNAYDLNEPDVVYTLSYFDDLATITDATVLARSYYVPSGATDPALPAGFDSADLGMFLILEGRNSQGDEASFAYNEPTSLGYTWGQAMKRNSGGGTGALGWGLALVLAGVVGIRRRRTGLLLSR